jgi:ABC-type polysaccharide/polyol phosphate export permease
MGALASTVIRYLRIYGKYKFQICMDVLWLLILMTIFGFMGLIFEPKEGLLPYEFHKFFLVGILFWGFFEAGYSEAVASINEEASMGTIGFLFTSGISPLTFMVGRMIAATFKSLILLGSIVLPILLYLGIIAPTLEYTLHLAVSLFFSWLFVLGVAIVMGSITLLFKKIGGTAGIVLQGIKIASGFYFPPKALPALAYRYLKFFPPTIGLEITREIMILGSPQELSLLLDNIVFLLLGTMAILIFSLIIYKKVEWWARKSGALEHY